MKAATGRVVAGKVEVDGEPLDEGQVVTVLAVEPGKTLELGADDEVALLAAIEVAERGFSKVDGA